MITKDQIEAAAAKLRALPVAEKTKLTKAEAIAKLKLEIEQVKEKGYTLEQIAEILKGEKIDVSVSSMKTYLKQKAKPRIKKDTPGGVAK